jgi:uncharacterized protein (TIGR03000 family)
VKRILLGLLMGLCVLTVPNTVEAGRGGGGGGGGGRGGGFVGGGRDFGRGDFGRGFYGYGRGFYGYGLGFYGGFYGPGLYGYGYGFGDPYLGDPYLYGGYGYGSGGGGGAAAPYYPPPPYYPPADPTPPANPGVPQAAPIGNVANIRLTLPTADTKVLVDGNLTKSSGVTRLLETPELKPGATYTYVLTATWEDGGRILSDTRKVDVAPGAVTTVDFTRPPPKP